MNDILFIPIRLDELEILIENSLNKVLKQNGVVQKNEPQKIEPDIVDIKQASELLNLAIPTIYGLVSRREIISYKRARKLYFKKSELLQWIQSGKRNSISEIQTMAKNFNSRCDETVTLQHAYGTRSPTPTLTLNTVKRSNEPIP